MTLKQIVEYIFWNSCRQKFKYKRCFLQLLVLFSQPSFLLHSHLKLFEMMLELWFTLSFQPVPPTPLQSRKGHKRLPSNHVLRLPELFIHPIHYGLPLSFYFHIWSTFCAVVQLENCCNYSHFFALFRVFLCQKLKNSSVRRRRLSHCCQCQCTQTACVIGLKVNNQTCSGFTFVLEVLEIARI